jgi:hypothetical protein
VVELVETTKLDEIFGVSALAAGAGELSAVSP